MLIVASVTFPRNRNRSKKRITRTITIKIKNVRVASHCIEFDIC
jgi:hypothetical protein